MEHRWNSRKEIDSAVTVHLQPIGAVKARVKNVSRTGMLLETNQFDLPRGGIVELAYTVMREAERFTLRLKALIVHAGDGLAGIMFIENAGHFAASLAAGGEHPLQAALHGGERYNQPRYDASGRAVGYVLH